MAIKSIRREPVTYTPAYGGNRDSKDPLTVVLTPLSREESDHYAKSVRFNQKKGYRNQWVSNTQEVQKKQFIERVQEVNGFLDCDSGEPITDIRTFYEQGPPDLIEEILNVILDVSQLEEQEVKN